jgi:dolichyl-diphosphooligosaccharide--protein glycosyltransferase
LAATGKGATVTDDAAVSFPDARPDTASMLERLLDVDAECESWRPADVGIDDTTVSRLVAAGYVESVADGYRVSDPEAVRATVKEYRDDTVANSRRRIRVRTALLVALALVVLVRLPTIMEVFRDDWVVLASNDPYFYRYLVDQSLAAGPLPSLPERALRGEPLLAATLAVAAWPFGAGTWGSGFVVAWYPVVAAVLTAALVYGAAARLTGDVRAGLAAAGLLAVTPAHAYRTALGVADHHAFDYLWLALTALAVIELLARSERDRRTWVAAAGLAVGVAGQALAWEAAPLLLLPLAPGLALAALVEIRRPGPERLAPVVAGLVAGAALAHLVHLLLGWQFEAVIYALDLLALGGVGLLALVVGIRRLDGSWTWLVAAEAALGAVAAVAVWQIPVIASELESGLAFFGSTQAAELAGVGANYGAVGVLVILGFASVLAAPMLVFAAVWGWQRLESGWFVVGVYTIHFGVLAGLQRRFAGELAPFAAILGGVGFVMLASWFDLVRPPVPRRTGEEDGATAAVAADGGDGDDLVVPDRTRVALLAGLAGVAVGSGSLYAALIDRRLVIDDGTYEAARWISAYVDEHDIPYPESFVLSKWGRNRVYNYFVNGEAESYAYAQRTYEEFLFSNVDSDPGWYEEFDGRVGFVVTRDLPHLGLISASTIQSTLHSRFGSATISNVRGIGHFRAVFATDDGARKVFRVVSGATIRGPAPDETDRIRLEADVSIPGAEFEYVRRATVTDGRFEVTVANPGSYRLGRSGRTVEVSERDVQTGDTVSVER